LLDHLPHTYPIPSAFDVLLSLVLFLAIVSITESHQRTLLTACFAGAIFPDLIDLGPAAVNRHLGWAIPVVKVFPWHWRQYYGSIYDHARHTGSDVAHLVVVSASLALLFVYGRSLLSVAKVP